MVHHAIFQEKWQQKYPTKFLGISWGGQTLYRGQNLFGINPGGDTRVALRHGSKQLFKSGLIVKH